MKSILVSIVAVVLLARCGKSPSESLIMAAKEGNLQSVKRSLGNSADIKAKSGKEKITALINASIEGHRKIVEFLIKEGADVNGYDVDGKTPVDYAVKNGHKEIESILRKNGGVLTQLHLKTDGKGSWNLRDEMIKNSR
ncbi:ankyrin repeat domain-containing protein [bacterium]|nr:ankyrin repeat domain-containing protein [bacterium]